MADDSRNPGTESPDTGSVVVTVKMPRWLKEEIARIAERRLSDSSAMIREALLAWIPSQKEDAA